MPKTVVVTGDFVLDHHIYEGRRHHYGDEVSPGVKVQPQVGGAALVHELLRALLPDEKAVPPPEWISRLAIDPPSSPADQLKVDPSEQAYAFWRPYPRGAAPGEQHWRVSEAMGFGAASGGPPCTSWPLAKDLPAAPDIIVLSEGGMGFRRSPRCWQHLGLSGASWIVLKTASPLAEGELWQHLSTEYRNKLVVIVSSRELRKSVARVSAGLSWEETIESLFRELRPGGALAALTQCCHLVVSFESEGGLWLDLSACKDHDRAPADDSPVHFVYDAPSIEGEHAHDVEGSAFGLLSCLAAGVVWHIILDERRPDLAAALEGGLSAMRDLREKGHGPVYETAPGYPAKRLANVIMHPAHRYSRAVFRFSAPGSLQGASATNTNASGATSVWSLLLESQREDRSAADLARLVVLRGPIALENLPHLRVGKLLTADRHEIESLRSLMQVIRRYQQQESAKKPLSIGVFGPPGAGKSFAVEELAGKFVAEKGWTEFNLSQFNTPADLIGAFHQIRDRVLQGMLPVAFFDEFDSQEYRWLQYLLAPMQDGKFQEGPLTHALGKCIFVVAGGTSRTFATFGPPEPQRSEPESTAYTKFRLAKGPDFKSRLDAYLDVVGPNRRQTSPPSKGADPDTHQLAGGHEFAEDPSDTHVPIRRALMIRSELKRPREEKLDIDEGVLHAILNVPRYTHGSRSLGKILQPFHAALPGPLHRSLLLSTDQLAMHTAADLFLLLCTKAPERFVPKPLSADDVAAMAPAIHDTWQALGRKEGWLDPKGAESFGELDDFLTASNRAAAERMPGVLALAGLQLESGAFDETAEADIRQRLEYHLELLADAEHEGWMQWHMERGWRYAPERNNEKKLHPCLLPFSDLKDVDRNKDRDQIRHYPDFARRAGKRIVFHTPAQP